MLKPLVLTAKRGFWLVLPTWLFVIYSIKKLFGGHYTQDSYAFYLLGKNIIDNFTYASPAIRDFYLDPTGEFLSRSYPPLFPLLVGISDFFLGEGIAAGTVLNLFIGMLALYVWFLISRKVSGNLFFIPFLIPIAYSVIPPTALWVDAVVGRSATLTLPLFLTVLYLLSTSTLFTNNKIAISIGFILGLLTLARFDTIMFCFALPAIIFLTARLSIKKTLLMYGALLLTMLPWAVRNFIVFGSFLASDNTLSASSTLPGILQLKFFEGGIPLGSDNPELWISQRIMRLKYNFLFLYSLLTSLNTWVAVSIPITYFVRIVSILFLPGLIFSFIRRKENYPLWIYFVVSLAWCILNLTCISLTSYGRDPRYYIVSAFVIVGGGSFFIALVIHHLFNLIFKKTTSSQTEKVRTRTIISEIAICLISVFITVHFYSKQIYHNTLDYFWSWTQHIENTPVKKGDLVAAKEAEIIAYHTGWNTIYLPINTPTLSDSSSQSGNEQAWSDYRAWLKRWKPAYLLVDLYDFHHPLAAYPHATVSTVLDAVILLKINLDEVSLTEQDNEHNTKMRNVWKQHILSKIPSRDKFFTNTFAHKRGISLLWDGFTVPNTPDNQLKFAMNRVVLLPNGEQRLIKETFADNYYWNVKVMGGAISHEFSVLPDLFETIDGDPPKSFFVTDATWTRGVAKTWAGFYIKDTPEHRQQYKAGAVVQLPTGEERTITKVTYEASLITVYLSGDPLDGYKVGTPDHFIVRDK